MHERFREDVDKLKLTDEQGAQLCAVLWRIMQGFADLGFSLKAGDNFFEGADHGMEDVLHYLIPEDTAPETAAPPSKTDT